MSSTVETACEPSDLTDLAIRGEEFLASLGEHYLRHHFVMNCRADDRLFAAARIEAFARGCFPRILVDPWQLQDQAPDISALESDVDYIGRVLRERPEAFSRLFDRLDDPDAFVELAEELGLTEPAATRAGGGLLALVVVLAACVVLAGCRARKNCPSVDPSGTFECTKRPGHAPGGPGTHVNNVNGRYRSW